jgi:hypothetical protein
LKLNLFQAQSGSMNVLIGANFKAGLTGLVFRASLSLKHSENVGGMVQTMVSNDADRMFAAGQFLLWGATSPLMIVASLALTIVLAGWAAIPGAVITVSMRWVHCLLLKVFFKLGSMVASRLLGLKGGQVRSLVLPHTSKRVQLIHELIEHIFFIKLSVIEDFFANKIFGERAKEVDKLRETGYIGAVSSNVVTAASFFSAMTTILILIGTQSTPLSPSVAFTLLSLYFGVWLPLIMFNNAVARFGAGVCFFWLVLFFFFFFFFFFFLFFFFFFFFFF